MDDKYKAIIYSITKAITAGDSKISFDFLLSDDIHNLGEIGINDFSIIRTEEPNKTI